MGIMDFWVQIQLGLSRKLESWFSRWLFDLLNPQANTRSKSETICIRLSISIWYYSRFFLMCMVAVSLLPRIITILLKFTLQKFFQGYLEIILYVSDLHFFLSISWNHRYLYGWNWTKAVYKLIWLGNETLILCLKHSLRRLPTSTICYLNICKHRIHKKRKINNVYSFQMQLFFLKFLSFERNYFRKTSILCQLIHFIMSSEKNIFLWSVHPKS